MSRLGAMLRGLLALVVALFALLLISDTLEGHLFVWGFTAAILLLLWLVRRIGGGARPGGGGGAGDRGAGTPA